MTVVHKKWVAGGLRKLSLAYRLSRSGLSLIVYRPAERWRTWEIVLGVLPLRDHCVDKARLLALVPEIKLNRYR